MVLGRRKWRGRCRLIATNVFGLGEGGLVGCPILEECFCPLLPNPCYKQYGIIAQNSNRRTEFFSFLFLSDGKNNFKKIK
jgi:hypothetical protein